MASVVLLHGISRSSRSMRMLERRLAREGYRTANWDYSSRTHDLRALADQLAPKLATLVKGERGPVHFVTHSMGGLVARVLLERCRPPRLGRVVMLAPPNGGSEVADLLRLFRPYRWWFGPAGAQLGTGRDEVTQMLFGPVNYELGVIAGNRSLYPVASALLPRPNDGRVSVAATAVEGMADHIVLPTSHPMIVAHEEALEQVVAFLRNGRFTRA